MQTTFIILFDVLVMDVVFFKGKIGLSFSTQFSSREDWTSDYLERSFSDGIADDFVLSSSEPGCTLVI